MRSIASSALFRTKRQLSEIDHQGVLKPCGYLSFFFLLGHTSHEGWTHLELVELCSLLNLEEHLVSIGRDNLDAQRVGIGACIEGVMSARLVHRSGWEHQGAEGS